MSKYNMRKLLLTILLFISSYSYAQNYQVRDITYFTENEWCYIGYYVSIITNDTTDFHYILYRIESALVTEKGYANIITELNKELNPKGTAVAFDYLTVIPKRDVEKHFNDKNPPIETIKSYTKALVDLKRIQNGYKNNPKLRTKWD